MPQQTLFLFGAGASAYANPSAAFNPPVGDKLFAAMEKCGLIPGGIPAAAIEKFKEPKGFEPAMTIVAECCYSDVYLPFLWNMARFFAPFLPEAECLYIRLLAGLREAGCTTFRIATLNYDNLIEHSMIYSGCEGAEVIKPHGSCGFMPGLPATQASGFSIVTPPNFGDMDYGARIVLDPHQIQFEAARYASTPMGPIMSFYCLTKFTKFGGRVISWHRNEWSVLCKQADTCFLVGLACVPEDDHIWGALANTHCRLIFVNPREADIDQFLSWANNVGQKNIEARRETFKESLAGLIKNCSALGGLARGRR